MTEQDKTIAEQQRDKAIEALGFIHRLQNANDGYKAITAAAEALRGLAALAAFETEGRE